MEAIQDSQPASTSQLMSAYLAETDARLKDQFVREIFLRLINWDASATTTKPEGDNEIMKFGRPSLPGDPVGQPLPPGGLLGGIVKGL